MRIQQPPSTGNPALDPWLQRLPEQFLGIGWNTVVSFPANDATPSVQNYNHFKTANASATTITMFDDGVEGQEIEVLIADAYTTIDFSGTNLKGNGGSDWIPSSGDSMRCVFDGTDWYCICSFPNSNLSSFSPISVSPAAFVPAQDTYAWSCTWLRLKNNDVHTIQYFYASVNFPDGVTITELTLYGYRDDASATLALSLVRNNKENAVSAMAAVTADWTSGYSSGSDTTIANAVIDNETYNYALRIDINPNDSDADVTLTGVEIAFQ